MGQSFDNLIKNAGMTPTDAANALAQASAAQYAGQPPGPKLSPNNDNILGLGSYAIIGYDSQTYMKCYSTY